MAVFFNAKGTTQQEFMVGKGGPKIKNSSGILEFRNNQDNDYVELRALGTNPSSNTTLVSKQYVDSVATGLDVKNSCRVATTSASELSGYTYVPGNEPTGNVWTGVSSAPVIDGVTLSDGDRLLIKDATDQRGNGIFTYNDTNNAFVRATDADNSPLNEVTGGMFCLITSGTINKGFGFTLTNPVDIASLGVDNLVFTQFSSAGTGLINVEDDLSPSLGGNLDVNGFTIISSSNQNIELIPNGSGKILLTGVTQLGNNLDVNGKNIITTGSSDIKLIPSGTGLVVSTSGYDMSTGPEYAFSTKGYVDNEINLIDRPSSGPQYQIQYSNGSGGFDASSAFTTNASGEVSVIGAVIVDNSIRIDSNIISTLSTNQNLILNPNGTGVIDASTSRITNVTDPTSAQDAATKAYVDNSTSEDLIGAANSTTIVDGVEVSSAVNYIKITNAITGNSPKIASTGSDSNVDLTIESKGAGDVILQTPNDGGIIMDTNTITDGVEISSDGNIILKAGSNLNVGLEAGAAPLSSNSAGGSISINGGIGDGTGRGGDVVLVPGESNGSGEYGNIYLNGSILKKTRVVTNTDTQSTDYCLLVNTSSSAVNIIIRSVDTISGRELVIKDYSGNANTNNITISTEGSELIDNATTALINTNWGSITLICHGTNWYII